MHSIIPTPMVYRSKDYQKLIDGRKYAMKYRDAVASLVVLDVVDRDRGLYTCEASNVHGYATSSAALRLKGNNNVSVTCNNTDHGPSHRQHLSIDVCLEDTMGDYQNCSALCCITVHSDMHSSDEFSQLN